VNDSEIRGAILDARGGMKPISAADCEVVNRERVTGDLDEIDAWVRKPRAHRRATGLRIPCFGLTALAEASVDKAIAVVRRAGGGTPALKRAAGRSNRTPHAVGFNRHPNPLPIDEDGQRRRPLPSGEGLSRSS